ncbi:MAG: hypothetical protein QM813_28045 [Verrucomicrobiota bacterium]
MKFANSPLVPKLLPPVAVFLSAVLMLFVAGCGATKPASASFASVTIRGHEPADIAKTAVAVFQDDGYTANSAGGQLIFEKEASKLTNVAYEGVVGSHYGAQTLVRVKVSLVDLGVGAYRLQCQAFIVKDAGDSFFAEEQKLANIRSRPYQNLLDEVASRLK